MCHDSNYICPSLSLFHFLSVCDCRKAVKATLVLLPLLGITYMLFFVNPGEDDISQIVFIYFNSFLQSFQVSHTLCLYRYFHVHITHISRTAVTVVQRKLWCKIKIVIVMFALNLSTS